MPTPAERKALLFLAGLALLGSSVRAARAYRGGTKPDATARAALRDQIEAVDSVRARAKQGRTGRTAGKPNKPPARRRIEQATARSPEPAAPQPYYVIMPDRNEPRADRGTGPPSLLPPPSLIDLDVATAAEIERLPYIGKRLAERIVADRDSFGPFGSLDGFQRVRGVGPALARRVQQNVTFSLTPRPFDVDEHRRRGGATRPRRSRSGGSDSR